MVNAVLDSSVLLAIINREPKHELAFNLLPNSIISSVIFAETYGIIISKYNVPQKDALQMLKQMISDTIPFNEDQAIINGQIEIINRKNKYGLSLADKSCIALGIYMKLPIYTADRIWAKLDILGANIKEIG